MHVGILNMYSFESNLNNKTSENESEYEVEFFILVLSTGRDVLNLSKTSIFIFFDKMDRSSGLSVELSL